VTDLREPSRDTVLAETDIFLVIRSRGDNLPEIHIAIRPDGSVTGYNGHVDLGTGIRTALAQIIAEELDVDIDRVTMVLGATSAAPDQGPTIASETIQVAARSLRLAAATARRHLVAHAARRLGVAEDQIRVEAGCFLGPVASLTLADLIAGRHERIEIDPQAVVKPVSAYRIVGTAQPRDDIRRKALGDWTYVHDVRVPGMLHGRVVRPPYVGYDHGPDVGTSLIAIDETSVADIPGLVAVVAIGDFVGVVATREEDAIRAADRLAVTWKPTATRPDLDDVEAALRANPSKPRVLRDDGTVGRALETAAKTLKRSYVWPYQMHASIGPSCAVADWRADELVVWSGTQNPYFMRRDLARLLDMPEDSIVVERYEAAGCYGRNCADDVTADAALLSRAVGRPVRVQLTRAQEHGWEPKGAAQVIDVTGGIDLEGGPAAYDFETRYPSNLAPTLALILTAKTPAVPDVSDMGDRTAIPPYAIPNMRVTVHDMPPIARASWFRGVSAMPNAFAHESFVDELATGAGVDPIDYRLRYLTDSRAIALVRAVRERAKWTPRTHWGSEGGEGDLLYGRGFAYALYVHGTFPGTAAAWAAWVADVAVNKRTGQVFVTKVTVGQDSGLMINPDGVRHQIHGNVIQSVSRTLKEKVSFTRDAVESREWGGYPILTFEEVPDIDVLLVPRPDEPPLGVGESASVPSAAAIVNAVYDATGVRFRELPLSPERILEGLHGSPQPRRTQPDAGTKRRRRWFGAGLIGSLMAGLGAITLLPGAIAAIQRPDPQTFSHAAIERGRLVAAAGACTVCHVSGDGVAFAGGRAFATPFGTVVASNISPDVETGIGGWSYEAFARAMRSGISRDGHHLYPVHPYPSFAGVTDADLADLYAYLMAEPATPHVPAPSKLAFPFNVRPLMAAWNALYLKPNPAPINPTLGDAWNRGAYLVETLGHCSACHSQRNALGAERSGADHLAGGMADGWAAPALIGSVAPVPWTKDALYDYLRSGHSTDHGAAGGPMAAVVKTLSALPDSDIGAMATYLAARAPTSTGDVATRESVIAAAEAAAESAAQRFPEGARLYDGACSACHAEGSGLASLALNTNVHAADGHNVLRTILSGAQAPATLGVALKAEVSAMPGFADTLSDRQLGELVGYVRARFAPGKPDWSDVAGLAGRLRVEAH
jgi:nicotinate dehydrogenase subunit B